MDAYPRIYYFINKVGNAISYPNDMKMKENPI